jgi:hypothetical protein
MTAEQQTHPQQMRTPLGPFARRKWWNYNRDRDSIRNRKRGEALGTLAAAQQDTLAHLRSLA